MTLKYNKGDDFMKKIVSLVLGVLISIGGLSTSALALTNEPEVPNEWYVDTAQYQEFIKDKDYETGEISSKFYKVTVDKNARSLNEQDYTIEEVSENEAIIGAMIEEEKILKNMLGRNSAQETLVNSYFEQTTSVYKWSGGYDVTSAYRWLGILATNQTDYIGKDMFSSAYSSEFSLDNNGYMVGITQSEDIYTNKPIARERTLSATGNGVVSMVIPYESELLEKNYRGMISYTVVRSFGSAGNIYTAYFDQTKKHTGSASISLGGEGISAGISISPSENYKLITAIKNNVDRNSFVLVNF